MKNLIAGRATAKEIDIARSYIAKGNGVDVAIIIVQSIIIVQLFYDIAYSFHSLSDFFCCSETP